MKIIYLHNGNYVIVSNKRDVTETIAEHCSYELAEFLQELFDEDDWEYECLKNDYETLDGIDSNLRTEIVNLRKDKFNLEIKIAELKTEIERLNRELSGQIIKDAEFKYKLRQMVDEDALPF